MSSFRRRHAEPADARAVAALAAAMDVAVQGSTDFTLADLQEEWRELDIARDAWVVLDAGRVVGYGTVEEHGDRWRTDGYVHPEAFGRGIGALLVENLENEVVARGATCVQTATLLADARAQALLTSRGYTEIRRFWQMRIELAEPPVAAQWPEGLTGTTFDPADAEAFWGAYEDAFADHWQHEREPFETWRGANVDRDDFSPGLWTVVRDGEEIVAGTICLPERNGVAWLSRLFTRRAWRRRGIGDALLADAFGKFWADGRRTIGLGVDAQNETGATHLYERAGMHVAWGAAVFEKEVR